MATRNSSSANKLSDVEHHLVHIASALRSIQMAANDIVINGADAVGNAATIRAAIENVGACTDSALKLIGCSQVVGGIEDWVGLPGHDGR